MFDIAALHTATRAYAWSSPIVAGREDHMMRRFREANPHAQFLSVTEQEHAIPRICGTP